MARHPITTYVSPETNKEIEAECKRLGMSKYKWSRAQLKKGLKNDGTGEIKRVSEEVKRESNSRTEKLLSGVSEETKGRFKLDLKLE